MYRVKRICIIVLIVLLITPIVSVVNALDIETKIDVIQTSSQTANFENDQGYIKKSIIDMDADKGEVTIELKISNTKAEMERNKYEGTDLVFVIDNSGSMQRDVNDTQTRRDVVIEAIKEFTTSFFQDVDNLRIGIVCYSSPNLVYQDGYYTWEGDTIDFVSELNGNENKIQSTLDNIGVMEYGNNTNTDSGIKRRKRNF